MLLEIQFCGPRPIMPRDFNICIYFSIEGLNLRSPPLICPEINKFVIKLAYFD